MQARKTNYFSVVSIQGYKKITYSCLQFDFFSYICSINNQNIKIMRKFLLFALLAVFSAVSAFSQNVPRDTSNIHFGDKFMTVTPYDDSMVFRSDAWYTNAFAYRVNGKDMFKFGLSRKSRKLKTHEVKVSYSGWADGDYVVGVEDRKTGRIEMALFRVCGDSVMVVFE